MARYVEGQAYKGLRNVSPQTYGSAVGELLTGWCVVVDAARAERIFTGASPTLEYMDEDEVAAIVEKGIPALNEPFDPVLLYAKPKEAEEEEGAPIPPESEEPSETSPDGSESGTDETDDETDAETGEETQDQTLESPPIEPAPEVSTEDPTIESSTSSETEETTTDDAPPVEAGVEITAPSVEAESKPSKRRYGQGK